MRARARVDQLRDIDRVAAWMAKIAINLCFEHRRRRETLSRLLPRLQDHQSATNGDLLEAVHDLSIRYRTVVVLFYAHGLTVAEIARLLDQKPVTVRSLLHRARRQLRAAMEPEGA